jgi:hypothetical protein
MVMIVTARNLDRVGRQRWARAVRVVGCMLGGLAVAASASSAPYNPAGLSSQSLARVSDICQSTLGLKPSEPEGPVWGAAMNPGLTSGENHYQGCIASLSSAMRRADTDGRKVQARQDCRSRGLVSDSPALAECVLQRLDGTGRDAEVMNRTPATVTDTGLAEHVPGSFFNASNREVRHREQLACARLGLVPGSGDFDGCVKTLVDTFFSIDNPQS